MCLEPQRIKKTYSTKEIDKTVISKKENEYAIPKQVRNDPMGKCERNAAPNDSGSASQTISGYQSTELVIENAGGTIHHDVFTYPPRPEPNPAFAFFFEKLEQVKKELNTKSES